MLEGNSSQSSNGASNSSSSGRSSALSSSASVSMFDEDDDFAVPDVPDVNGNDDSQGVFDCLQ